MNHIDLTAEEVEQLTAAIREGAAAIVQAWKILGKIGERTKRDWEPEPGNTVCDIMERFASKLTAPEDVTAEAVKMLFGRPEDWL